MKVSAARGDLLDAIAIVSRGLSSRSTLPILSSIMVIAEGDALILYSTDLEVSVRHSLGCRIDEEGTMVIPGKLLGDIVRSLPEAAVTISAQGPDHARVSCEQVEYDLRTLPADDFPRFPEVDPEKVTVLPVDTMSDVVRQVARAASRDETRPVLTGVLTVIGSGVLKMVATDSYRLAVREVGLEEPAEEVEVVIPGKAVSEIPRLAGGADELRLGVSENQVVFEFGNTTFVSRRIEGRFPNYGQLIPSDTETKVTLPREELLEAAKRVSLLAQHNVPLRSSVDVEAATLTLSANTQDVGKVEENLMVQAEGEDIEIAFNAAFFIDGVASMGSEEVTFETVSPLKPGVLRSVGDEEYTYIIMPVRLG